MNERINIFDATGGSEFEALILMGMFLLLVLVLGIAVYQLSEWLEYRRNLPKQ